MISPARSVIFRCDASTRIGSGHVMRCLTLADQITKNGGICYFVCRRLPGNLIAQIAARGHKVHALAPPNTPVGWLGVGLEQEIAEFRDFLADKSPDRIVVDHYGIDIDWETAVAPNGCPVMVIDDMADRQHACDILLDQNLGRHAQDYAGLVPDDCQLLIGPDYALLRPEFATARPASLLRRRPAKLRHIMISMGGADADNITSDVLNALADCDSLPTQLHITVVMGGTAPHLGDVRTLAKSMPVHTEVKIDVSDMARLMCESDLAIGAAGGTSWERCCLGLPALILVLAENQLTGATGLAKSGAAVLLGDARDRKWVEAVSDVIANFADSAKLTSYANKAAAQCDGSGAQRVINVLDGVGMLRPARMSDAPNIYEWRYAQDAAKYYRNSTIPDMSHHRNWLARALQNPNMYLRIFTQKGVDLGHIRFDLNLDRPNEAEIGICVSKAVRRQGLGARVLRAAISHPPPNVTTIKAEVHDQNLASLRLFEKMGFETEKRDGHFLSLTLSCPSNESPKNGSSKGHFE